MCYIVRLDEKEHRKVRRLSVPVDSNCFQLQPEAFRDK